MDKNQGLRLTFHGRIIDHIGIQMYQSPTASLAEAVSNSWDADATRVEISFDFESKYKSEWKITVKDNGIGMTMIECQEKFLNVGFNRRKLSGEMSAKSSGGRPLMGRKGIGKFAGFGIARYIDVDTVSKYNNERTVFELDLYTIRKGDSYVSTDHLDIKTNHPAVEEGHQHGTIITLRDLGLGKRIGVEQFRKSLARRFLINAISDEFDIIVDGIPVSNHADVTNCEMSFPSDLSDEQKKEREVSIDDEGWGTEIIPGGNEVRWRVLFFEELLNNKELSGITVFAHKKMAQSPFIFNLSGSLVSQAGPEYMSGQVVADWIDEFDEDLISTERRRLNWEHPEMSEFQDWGQNLIKKLLSIWKSKRSEEKMKTLESKVENFLPRLKQLGPAGRTARTALNKLAGISKLSKSQFQDMGSAILLAVEKGKLLDIIEDISNADEMDDSKLLEILMEAQIITTLHTAEVVYTKLQAINGLQARVEDREIENDLRDFISKHPWLISPGWETYASETSLAKICEEAAKESFENREDFRQRVDLILSSNSQLLVLEFMRPGLTLDYDHLLRIQAYIGHIRSEIEINSGLGFDKLTAYIIADNLSNRRIVRSQIPLLEKNEIYAMDWKNLILKSKRQWKEFLDHVKLRSPDDPRLRDFSVFGMIEPGKEE